MRNEKKTATQNLINQLLGVSSAPVMFTNNRPFYQSRGQAPVAASGACLSRLLSAL